MTGMGATDLARRLEALARTITRFTGSARGFGLALATIAVWGVSRTNDLFGRLERRLTVARLCGHWRASQTRSWPTELAICPASRTAG
jgi:low affinity Fe/Cu permease